MDGILGRFLSFDRMMAGSIIKVLYYILLVLLILGAVFALFQQLFAGEFLALITVPIGLLIALLMLRVFAEIYIVLFRISDNLSALRKLKEQEIGSLDNK